MPESAILSECLEIFRLRSSFEDIKKPFPLFKGIFAEFLAVLLFVFVGCSSTISGNTVTIALCFGLGIASLVWIFGDVSGGHINPAVTFAMLITRRISLVRGILYIGGQVGGSIVGAILSRVLIFAPSAPAGFCVNTPLRGIADGQAMCIELMATLILVFTIFAAVDNARRNSGSEALAIGLAVSLSHFAFVPITGASMNPARSFGPAVMAQQFDRHWVYWIGPLLGALVAAILYQLFFSGTASENNTDISAESTNAEYQHVPSHDGEEDRLT